MKNGICENIEEVRSFYNMLESPALFTSKNRNAFLCVDCDVDTGKIMEYYMLTDFIWNLAMQGQTGMICIGCFEKRLGRRLKRSDFDLMAPMNYWKQRSDRLKSRFGE